MILDGPGIRRAPLNPVATAEVLYQGAIEWRNAGGQRADIEDVIWFLIGEAMQTDRSIRLRIPRAIASGWPDVWISPGERVAAYNERYAERRVAEKEGRVSDDFYAPSREKVNPTAHQLARYEHVMDWVARFVGIDAYGQPVRQRKERLKMFLALAAGMSPTRAMEAFPTLNYGSRHGVISMRRREVDRIVFGVTNACPKIRVGAA